MQYERSLDQLVVVRRKMIQSIQQQIDMLVEVKASSLYPIVHHHYQSAHMYLHPLLRLFRKSKKTGGKKLRPY